jgi:branched-chain amino acid transport system substrate-binding protein
MSEQDTRTPAELEGEGLLSGKAVSRRQFLKVAGIAGAAIGAGAGLGGLLAACGGEAETTTTTTAGGATTTTAGATTTSAGATTTVSAGAEAGAEIKCGYVLPITGAMAAFGAAASWEIDYFNKNVWKDGLVLGDGKLHKITVLVQDMQSDSNRAAQVAGDLITNSKVTLIGASASAANVVPVRDQAEALECPCITYDCPGDAWNAGQPDGGFKWCWHTWFIFKDMAANFFGIWGKVPNNKKIGGLFPNNADGIAFATGLPPAFQANGFTYVDPGRFQDGSEDYSAIISQFKKEGVEIICGVCNPPDFSNFWKQAVQQGFKPKISTQPKALLFPDGVEALGDLGAGQTVETWFHPKFPFKSDITGLTAQEVADKFSADNNRQWTQPVCFFGQFEVWTDILKRAKDPTDKNSIIEATKQTNLMTIGGPVNWSVNPEPYSGWWNFSRKPITGGQWVKGKGKYKYDLEIVANVTDPDIPTTAEPMAIA